MGFFSSGGRGRTTRMIDAAGEPGLEMLESRLALYQGPMIAGAPPIASLENQNDTVVRVDTNLGKFDLELFDSLAPVTVTNFLNYIRAGRFDESIFHSLLPGLLYGGQYKFSDAAGLPSYVPQYPVIPNGFSRSNLAGTITMVPYSATTAGSAFAINLVDNPVLNTTSGGYTVFGKVVQGMSVLTTIGGLSTQDFNTRWGAPTPGPYWKVPVTGAYNGTTGPTEATLVRITDIEITKAAGTNRYYEQSYVLSEGLRTATSIERIDLVNMEGSFTNNYQVILRYESGDRDQVIATGVLPVGARKYIKINDLGSLVRSGVNYSIEVRSTRAMGVSFDHRDAGYTIGEEFLIEARMIDTQLKAWNFADGAKGTLDQTFVNFESLTDQNINVYMLIFPESGAAPTFIGMPLAALRRGTVAIHTLAGVPDGNFSVQISSTGPIVATLEHFKTGGGGNASDGDMGIGVTSAGRVEGFLAAAIVPTGGESHVDFFYSAGSPAFIVVDVEIILSNGTVITPSPITLSNAVRKSSMDLSAVPGVPLDQYFSVHYTSRNGVTPVTAGFSSELAGDSISTSFMTMTTRTVVFADGYTDPTLTANQESEVISVFNPYATNVSFLYDLNFHFSDGTTILAAATGGPPGFFSLGPRARRDHQARDFPAVMTKINSNPAFWFYSVEVISVQFTLPQPVGGVVAQLTRVHNTWGQAMTTGPGLDPRLPVLFMENPEFH